MSKLDLSQLDKNNIPQHVAVIMDGNGRWAKQRGKLRIFGHTNAITAVRETVEAAAEIGVKYLTLYAFSTENWGRPKTEVDGLMELLVSALGNEVKKLHQNGIRLETIGDINSLPPKARKAMEEAKEFTKNNKHMTLVIALSYSSKWELVEAAKSLAREVESGQLRADQITEELFASKLNTANWPDPELMIRTSGEMRISNYLLWQLAYAEFYFTETLWPDFRKQHFLEAIQVYQQRERRFGKTSEQLNGKEQVK
jgi:undecaprenyl diphosphate synthase